MDSIGPDINNKASLFLVTIQIAVNFIKISKESIDSNHHLANLVALEKLFQDAGPAVDGIGEGLRNDHRRPNWFIGSDYF